MGRLGQVVCWSWLGKVRATFSAISCELVIKPWGFEIGSSGNFFPVEMGKGYRSETFHPESRLLNNFQNIQSKEVVPF